MTELDKVYDRAVERLHSMQLNSQSPPNIRLWDGNWNFMGYLNDAYDYTFPWEDNESAIGMIQLDIDSPVAQQLLDPRQWPTKSLYVTADSSGARWSGRVKQATPTTVTGGDQYLQLELIHDWDKLKEILCWANPFFPDKVQFPKAWVLAGPARWTIATTLFVNLLRKNVSLWKIPDDPLNLAQWFNLNMSQWSMVVKPIPYASDSTIPITVVSRFKYFHEVVGKHLKAAQVSITVRRYLDGDPQPIEGKTLRHGCLVVDVQDKSAFTSGTSFFGSLLQGLRRSFVRVTESGLVEDITHIERPRIPEEYNKKRWLGTVPAMPWVVLSHGPNSPISASEYTYEPPGPSQFVTGGSSMPGVNEAIKAAVIAAGGFVGSLIHQSYVGTALEAVLEPLYKDTLLAFNSHKYQSRIKEHGWDYPYEQWVQSQNGPFNIGHHLALYQAWADSKEKYSIKLSLENGNPYFIGDSGMGDFFIGDRVAVNPVGLDKDFLFVAQVKTLTLSAKEGWTAEIGQSDVQNGTAHVASALADLGEGLREQGVW